MALQDIWVYYHEVIFMLKELRVGCELEHIILQ